MGNTKSSTKTKAKHQKIEDIKTTVGKNTVESNTVPDEVAHDPYKLLLYKKAIRKGKEKENTLRINIIGNYAQGKTSLANRLIGNTCDGVTTTNGIEINRYKCQTSDDGTNTFISSENENHEFVSRVASVARSIEQTIRSDKGETDLEENLTYDFLDQTIGGTDLEENLTYGFLDQTMPRQETLQDQSQPIEISHNVSVEVVANKFNDAANFVQPVSLQTPQVNEERILALSSGEMATFSNVVEVQKDSPEKFFDIWDFGGQYIFYATHTLFHSRKALYLLVFDLTKSLDTIVLDEEFPGETGDRNMEYFARFWMESIHAYAGPDPQVILVGTHKDKLPGNDRLWKEYFENIRRLFDDTELIYHIQKEDFAVDNHDMSDPGIVDLLAFIFKKHEEQVHPVEIPARWMQLEKVLRALKTPIISFQDVVELDKRNEYPLFDEEQLKLFLHYHHEKGSLFFYDEDRLSDFVCLDPKFLIDAFKCIITSEQFYKNDPDIRSLWKVLSKEGRLTRQLINKVWSNRPDFVKHEGVIIGFLQKQNIISEVAEYNTKSGEKKKKDWFIVPSLLKDHSSKEELMFFLDRKSQSQVRYLMKFDKSSIVHLTFHKALAAALGTWPVLNCGTKRLLFENLCVFKLKTNHAGILQHRKDSKTIELRVINLLPNPVETHPADEFRRFVEAVALHEFRRLKYHLSEKDKPFVGAYRCNHTDHGQEGSSELNYFKEDEAVICPDNITHDNFDYRRAKEEWTMENTSEMYPKMQLTNKTLSRLSQVAIGTNWRLLGPLLGIKEAEIDHIKEQHQRIEMQIYEMLRKWKDRSAEKATLDLLVDAIKKCPRVSIYWDEIRNTKDEYLRKLEKLEIDFTQPLSDRIVTVNETLILECEITKINLSIIWLKDGESITQDGRKMISSDGKLHKLVVEDVTVEDAGKYTCVYGNARTECFVKIEDPHGPLKFMKELSNKEAGNIHSAVTFLCELNNSQTEVEWYYRNQRLHPSNKYAIIDDGSIHMLKIRDVSEKDEGTYSVLAKGIRSEATLYVEETEEERYLLLQHRKKHRANDDSKHLKGITKLRSDLDVTGAQTTLNIPHIWSTDSVKNYTIKAKGDKQACVIYGCCMLPTGEILLADWNNRRLKKLNDRYQVIRVRDLPGFPCDVCYCGNNEAVLAMVNKMQFVDVRGGMSLTWRVKTDHDCRGLACHGNRLYVVGGSSIYIYSTGGLPSRFLYIDHSGRVSFRHIAVSDNGNYIYITDTTSQIHTIDSSGNHLYTCTDPELHGAWGVCVDGEGHVLTCNRVSKKVLQISSDCKQKLGIIADRTSVSNTDVLCFNRGNATLVTAGVSDEIVVLKLK